MEGLLYIFLAKLADPVLVLVAGVSAYLAAKKQMGWTAVLLVSALPAAIVAQFIFTAITGRFNPAVLPIVFIAAYSISAPVYWLSRRRKTQKSSEMEGRSEEGMT